MGTGSAVLEALENNDPGPRDQNLIHEFPIDPDGGIHS